MIQRLQKTGVALFIALALGGCYATAQPVLDSGQWADLAGSFTCDSIGGRRNEVFTEQKNGWILPAYTYSDKDGTELKLKHLSGTLYLAQGFSAKDKSYSYAYIDFLQHDHVVLLMADIMSKGPYIEELAKKYDVKIAGATAGGLAVLNGDKNSTLRFLTAHDKSLLATIADCKRQT